LSKICLTENTTNRIENTTNLTEKTTNLTENTTLLAENIINMTENTTQCGIFALISCRTVQIMWYFLF
jgi:hypothetical protein